jgi:hypothetical protein
MTSNNGTFKDGNPSSGKNPSAKDSDATRELSYEVFALHNGYSDHQEFWAAAEHDEPCGPQLNVLKHGFPKYMNTWFTNHYMPSSPPDDVIPREESQSEVQPSANLDDASIFQGHPSSSSRLPSHAPLDPRQVGRDGGRGFKSPPGLSRNNLHAFPHRMPYEPTADNFLQTQNASQPAYNQQFTTQQRQTLTGYGDRHSEQQGITRSFRAWARDSPSLSTCADLDEMDLHLDGSFEYSNGLQHRNSSDRENHNQSAYPTVPEPSQRRPRERLPFDTSYQNQEPSFPQPQSEARSSVPKHYSARQMGNAKGDRDYYSSSPHMPQQNFMNENSVPISYQEYPTILVQWRRVWEVYGTSIGILLTSMMIMNLNTSDYAEKDRWLTQRGLSDTTRQIFHGRFRVPPQLSGMMQMNVPAPRKRKDLKDAIKAPVEPSSWPGTTDFSELRVHFESIRKKALELLELLREGFNNAWDEHRDKRFN